MEVLQGEAFAQGVVIRDPWKTCTSEVVAEDQAQNHRALAIVTYIWAAKLIPSSPSSDYINNLGA